MSGITDLNEMLRNINPVLHSHEYVYCTLPELAVKALSLRPIMEFHEREGRSIVITRDKADANGLCYESVFRLITLQVNSSLESVGLTAAFTRALAERGISVNVVAAYYHDHVFVPSDRAEEALEIIASLAR